MPNQPYVLGLPFSRFNYECQEFFFFNNSFKVVKWRGKMCQINYDFIMDLALTRHSSWYTRSWPQNDSFLTFFFIKQSQFYNNSVKKVIIYNPTFNISL